jgi:curved DNA-binding protein CbpA
MLSIVLCSLEFSCSSLISAKILTNRVFACNICATKNGDVLVRKVLNLQWFLYGVISVNYYDILGVSPSATSEDINATHKALAKMYHPDVNSSEDAHEKMAKLNEANDVLSDTVKREKYDNELKRNRQQETVASQTVRVKRYRGTMDAEQRISKAELLRKKAEARLKTEEASRKRRKERDQQKAEKAVRKKRQEKAERDKQYVIDGLSALVMDYNAKRNKKTDVDDERYYATKVLLSMVRRDDTHLRRMAEEAERKQRIEEILTLVKKHNDNDKDEWV